MKTHNLKIQPQHYAAVLRGEKKAEFRRNDRDFAVGDLLCLFEYGVQPEFQNLVGFTGLHVQVRITHITDLTEWAPGYVMLSFEGGLCQP